MRYFFGCCAVMVALAGGAAAQTVTCQKGEPSDRTTCYSQPSRPQAARKPRRDLTREEEESLNRAMSRNVIRSIEEKARRDRFN